MKGYRISIIRHGMTEANEKGIYIGNTDIPLSAKGAADLAAKMDEFCYPTVHRVYSSPLKRCTETAEILFPYTELCTVDDLKELNFGEFENKTIDELTQEIARLKTYEDNQVEFEKIKDEFDNEVVFNSKAPGIEEYRKYYEEIDPTNAEILYKEVVKQEEVSAEIKDYAKAYSEMKAKDAAVIFNSNPLKNDLELSAKILGIMKADARGSILAEIGKLDADLAGNITEIMDPDTE